MACSNCLNITICCSNALRIMVNKSYFFSLGLVSCHKFKLASMLKNIPSYTQCFFLNFKYGRPLSLLLCAKSSTNRKKTQENNISNQKPEKERKKKRKKNDKG